MHYSGQIGVLKSNRNQRKLKMEKLRILPLPEQLYREAEQNQVGRIELKFKKDRDETFLDISFLGRDNRSLYDDKTDNLYEKFEKWAWRAYNYKDVEVPEYPGVYTELHGICIHYYLVSKRAQLTSWITETARVDGPVNEVCELDIELETKTEGVNYGITSSKLEEIRQKVQDISSYIDAISSYINVSSSELKEISKNINPPTEDNDNNERD